MSAATLELARAQSEQLTNWRRHLHAHPELSGQERETARYIAGELRKIGYEPRDGIGGHGVVAELPRDGAAWIALRADTDALPIVEDTGVAYASAQSGAMHACGHDAHAAMLLGAARLLYQQRAGLRRSVRLIFQPHEEKYPGGAPGMIAAGVLEGVEAIFGLHITSTLPTGELGTRAGPFMAAVNPVSARIIGKGGHAAMPDQTIDPVVIAAQAILALQTIVSRSVPITEPTVVSITQVRAGSADNVIPGEVSLCGTIRSFSEKVRNHACRRVREIIEGTARTFGGSSEVEILPGYPVLVNDGAIVERAVEAARQIGFAAPTIRTLPPIGGGEDFAYYCERTPGAFVFLGAANPAKNCVYPHHHPKFNIDEDALPAGAALLAEFALSAGK